MHSFDAPISDPVSRHVPSAGDVKAELERILSSPHFPASERRRAFLRFIVDETLSGRSDQLKGFTVATVVFGRDETFDSQADPVVRIEAHRLRRDLDSYYVDAGSDDPVRISIPKGSYVPHFEWHQVTPVAMSDGEQVARSDQSPASDAPGAVDAATRITPALTRNSIVAALVAVAVAIGIAGWLVTAGKQTLSTGNHRFGPAVVVLPFKALSFDDNSRYLASGIDDQLTRNLMRFPSFRVFNLPIGSGNDGAQQPAKVGSDFGVSYVVSGSVRSDAANVFVAAQLADAMTGEVLWSEAFNRSLTSEDLIGVQVELAGNIASVIGQPYGAVNNDLELRVAMAGVSSVQSYICVLRAYGYRRDFSRKEFGPVLQCLEEAVRRDPRYSDAWAMLGWLHLDAGRFEFAGDGNTQEAYQKALKAADRAIKLGPKNTLALKALSSIDHYLGRYDESERLAREAVALNPYDPDTLAQLGWRLAVRGKFEEGIPILKRAVERTINPPGWYFHLIAVELCLKRDYAQMLEVAQRSENGASGVSEALIAIAAGALGKRELAQQALEKMSTFGQIARDPAAYFRRHGATDEIVNALMTGLQKARRVASGS